MALGAAVPVSVAFASWAARPGAGRPHAALGAGYALALGSVAVIMTATDAFTVAVRLGGADRRVLPARRVRAGPSRTGPVRRGSRSRSGSSAAPRCWSGCCCLPAVALDRAGLVRHVPGGAAQDHRAGAADRRVRGQGGPGAVPGVDAARLRRRARPGAGGHGRGLRQRRVLRHVADAGAARPPAGLAGRDPAAPGRVHRAARHRARRGAEPAAAGHRLLQRGEQRADHRRLRRCADRRGRRDQRLVAVGPAGRHACR